MLKKIVICILVLVAAVAPITAFAVVPNGNLYQGDFFIKDIYEINYDIIASIQATKQSDSRTKLNIKLNGEMFVGNKFTLVVCIDALEKIVSTPGAFLGEYTILTDMNWTIRDTDVGQYYRADYDDNGDIMRQDADEVLFSDIDGNDKVVVKYTSQETSTNYRYYYNIIPLECLVSDISYNIYVDGLTDFELLDWNVYVGQTVLDIEENKANAGGNNALDGALDALGGADKSRGFLKPLAELATAFGNNSTAGYFIIPRVYIPKIDGVIDEITLIPRMAVPLREYYREYIPSNVRTLIEAITTIALIVFCFKELYSIISYIITLKSGGADE